MNFSILKKSELANITVLYDNDNRIQVVEHGSQKV